MGRKGAKTAPVERAIVPIRFSNRFIRLLPVAFRTAFIVVLPGVKARYRRARHSGRSVTAHEVEEPTLVVVIEIGQVIAEIGEVVTGADTEILAKIAVH